MIGSVPFTLVLHEEILVSYVLDIGQAVPGRSRHRTVPIEPSAPRLNPASRPGLALGSLVYVDDDGAVRLRSPMQPTLEPRRDYFLALCTRRELAVSGDLSLVWRLLRQLDGLQTAAQIVDGLSPEDADAAAQLLAELAAVGIVDVSGRPTARFVHDSTKRGAVVNRDPADMALDYFAFAADGDYRSYPDRPQAPLEANIPERLAALHALTRQRRSGKGFSGEPITRADFEALLSTACGVTGSTTDGDRTISLRAYPAGGALYAIEVYPVVTAVTDLSSALYHYRVNEHTLELLQPDFRVESLLDITLPMQREYLRGVAAILLLTANFARFERKYGQNSYRALAAEAGVLAQNLILAATALGLRARPIGGFFDDLLNPLLALDTSKEQFMLAVLLGHPDPAPTSA